MSDGTNTPVFCRIDGKLARFEVDTGDHARAIDVVKDHLALHRATPDGAVLACVEGGKQ